MRSTLTTVLLAANDHATLALLVKATVAMAVALAAVSLAKRSRAAVRHALLLAAFGVLLVLPVASAVVPDLTIAMPAAPVTTALVEPVDVSVPKFVRLDDVSSPMPVAAPVPSASPMLPSGWTLLVFAWALGALVSLTPVVVGLWQVASLRRSALPWIAGRRLVASMASGRAVASVDVVLHESLRGPMTCGTVRPAIVLPHDIEAWPADDVYRALVHELEHVRRHDWLSQCVARLVCAAYWFHPLVWIAWRRFTLEAERVCDDAVLRQADASQYAEQLVDLARRLSVTGSTPLLAMASRRDLAARVRALLDRGQARGPLGVPAVLCTTVAAAVLVAGMASLRVVASAAPSHLGGQRFSVASVRPCAPDPSGANDQQISPGRVTTVCRDLVSYIEQAYQLYADGRVRPPWAAQRFLISGGPAWAGQDRYTIEAIADGPAGSAEMLGPMTQHLLEDRFKLKLHHEMREVPVYELVAASAGAKVAAAPAGTCVDRESQQTDPAVPPTLPTGQHWCKAGWHLDAGHIVWENEGLNLDEFALLLRGFADRPVVNATGITGPVAFRLNYEPSTDLPANALAMAMKQQLGLELRPSKASLDFIVIDRAERPTDVVSAPVQAQRFEAVSIRPCQDDTPPPGVTGQRSGQGGFPTVSPGRFTIECGTIERLISNAYVLNGESLENNTPRIGDVSWWKGGPEWIRYDKFTIEASAPGVTDRKILLGPMLRTLLEERFGVKLHRDTEQVPMYALTVAKSGLKIQPMAPGGCNASRDDVYDAASARANADAVNAGTAKPNCDGMTMMGTPGRASWTLGGSTIPNFAGTLTSNMDLHVLDKTGLDPETKYNIHLEFAPDEHVPGTDKRNPRTTFAPPDAPTIFNALEQQLGLKLEATKGPQGVLVIDHVDHPKADGGWTTWSAPMRAKGAGR